MKETQRSKDLSEALIKCKAFAKRGYKLAKDAVSTLENVIANVSKTLQAEIKKLENKNFNDNGTNNMLAQQLSSIRSSFEILPQRLAENISALSKTAFSITLFGRTMAGKSTLMEILTEGNGSSIGKGAQRTTRDVRTYKYENLDVTDVPGIAAFEGKDDEDTAFKAARKSDLVLFLITDDAPQASETECLNKIRALGKPVICLINVKANIDKPSDIKMFRHDIKQRRLIRLIAFWRC